MYRSKTILASLAFALAGTILCTAADEKKDSSSLTIALTAENFAKRMIENDFVILFFAPE